MRSPGQHSLSCVNMYASVPGLLRLETGFAVGWVGETEKWGQVPSLRYFWAYINPAYSSQRAGKECAPLLFVYKTPGGGLAEAYLGR